MRLWWWVGLVACSRSTSTPSPAPVPLRASAPPAPTTPPAPVAPTWPALGTDLAVIRETQVQLWTAASLPTAAPTVVTLSAGLAQPTWGGDHRVYALVAGSTSAENRTGIAVDATGGREFPIVLPPMTKAQVDKLGFPLGADLEAYDDGSVWFVRCWGPKYHPKSSHCETYRRVRLDAPGSDSRSSGEHALVSDVKRRAERPLPVVAPPSGWNIVLADGVATVTCAGTTVTRGKGIYDTYSAAMWLSRDPPLYALDQRGSRRMFRSCDDQGEGEWTAIAVGDGYYAYHDGGTWKLARDGQLVRDLGDADAVIFGP